MATDVVKRYSTTKNSAPESIKVAARVRPFNSREIRERATLAVSMDGPSTTILGDKGRTFNFDYSYWSHDESSPNFVKQDRVQEDIGRPIATNAMNGFHGCLFAYGQTGSGKTYSMLGTPDEPGMVPFIVQEIFRERARLEDVPDKEIRIWVSYLELYNDHLHDLLAPQSADNHAQDLKVVDNPRLGVYVPNLTEEACENVEQVMGLLDFGTKRRAVGATAMNGTSSRSHAIFCVSLQHLDGPVPAAGQQDTRLILSAKINLVDLAGSERQKKTGTVKSQFAEGCSINRSLSALGLVIKELTELMAKKSFKMTAARNLPVAFRAAKLTFILRDSLAGNSKTYMLAAISPSSSEIDETLSTLRFAASVKTIMMVTKQNRDKKDELIAELRAALEAMREQSHAPMDGVSGDSDVSHYEQLIEDMKKSYESQLSEAKRQQDDRAARLAEMSLVSADDMQAAFGVQSTTPYLLNMADDPTLAGCLVFYLPKGKVITLGSDKTNDIALSGLGISSELCTLENKDDLNVYVRKTGFGGRLSLDGMQLNESDGSQLITHGQRLVLGRAHAMKITIPSSHQAQDSGKELDLFLDIDEEDQAFVDKNSPYQAEREGLQSFIDQATRTLPDNQAQELVQEVRHAMKICTEANDITEEVMPDAKIRFRVELTATAPYGVMVSALSQIRYNATGAGGLKQRRASIQASERVGSWSLQSFTERVERMRDIFHSFSHFGPQVLQTMSRMEDPWVELPHEEIQGMMEALRTKLEDKEVDHMALKMQMNSQRHGGGFRRLLGGALKHGVVLRATFAAWVSISKRRAVLQEIQADRDVRTSLFHRASTWSEAPEKSEQDNVLSHSSIRSEITLEGDRKESDGLREMDGRPEKTFEDREAGMRTSVAFALGTPMAPWDPHAGPPAARKASAHTDKASSTTCDDDLLPIQRDMHGVGQATRIHAVSRIIPPPLKEFAASAIVFQSHSPRGFQSTVHKQAAGAVARPPASLGASAHLPSRSGAISPVAAFKSVPAPRGDRGRQMGMPPERMASMSPTPMSPVMSARGGRRTPSFASVATVEASLSRAMGRQPLAADQSLQRGYALVQEGFPQQRFASVRVAPATDTGTPRQMAASGGSYVVQSTSGASSPQPPPPGQFQKLSSTSSGGPSPVSVTRACPPTTKQVLPMHPLVNSGRFTPRSP